MLINSLSQNKQSLVDIKSDFIEITGEEISKVAIHKKFTSTSVLFVRQLLNELISGNLSLFNNLDAHKFFSCINIKDSSKFLIPLSYQKDYP